MRRQWKVSTPSTVQSRSAWSVGTGLATTASTKTS